MNRVGNQCGFMLLEVILAVSLLVVGLFALIDAVGRCVASAQSVQNYSIAQMLLANKGFEFRTERPGDLLDQEGVVEDYPQYSWSRRFEAAEEPGLFKQTIAVAWYERGKVASDSVVEYRYLPNKQP